MNPDLIKAVCTEHGHARHILTAVKETGWDYPPVSNGMHGNTEPIGGMHRDKEPGKDDLA